MLNMLSNPSPKMLSINISSSPSLCYSFISSSPPLKSYSYRHPPTARVMVSCHQSLSPLPADHTVVGCGGVSMDYLVMVDEFPKPDEKIRSTSYKVQGGGNVGNALTCAARLGLKPKIIAKVAEDSEGIAMLDELAADGVDTSFVVVFNGSCHFFSPGIESIASHKEVPKVSKEGRSMYSYVIVDSKMKTRTAIYQPGYPPMTPDDFTPTILSSALHGAKLVYFDGLSLKTALVVAGEACRRNIPILVDAEMGEEGFDNLLNIADYAICSAKYPQAWTMAPSIPSALVCMLTRLPKLKFVVVTLGEEGCIMLQRTHNENDAEIEETDVDECLASLSQKKDSDVTSPMCISSPVMKLKARGIGALTGRLLVGTAEKIPPLELVDTTGAGDAFVGSVLYALCTDMPPEIMLPFAAQVASRCCRDLGARTGLPHRTDPCLQPFLSHKGQMLAT